VWNGYLPVPSHYDRHIIDEINFKLWKRLVFLFLHDRRYMIRLCCAFLFYPTPKCISQCNLLLVCEDNKRLFIYNPPASNTVGKCRIFKKLESLTSASIFRMYNRKLTLLKTHSWKDCIPRFSTIVFFFKRYTWVPWFMGSSSFEYRFEFTEKFDSILYYEIDSAPHSAELIAKLYFILLPWGRQDHLWLIFW
jgi:hypothetical protein